MKHYLQCRNPVLVAVQHLLGNRKSKIASPLLALDKYVLLIFQLQPNFNVIPPRATFHYITVELQLFNN
jgi:hypothetical protein